MKLRGALIAMAFGFAGMLAVSANAQEKKPDKPADKPPAAKPADKPADKPAAAPAAKPADKPAAAPAAKPADKPADKGAPAGMSPDDMKKMMEMATPGKEHEALKPLEGTFNCAMKMMMPGAPPTESKGTVTRKWIMGGRFLQEDFKGDFMGMPMEGMGITGYDIAQKKYHGYWIDSMGTGSFVQTGTADASGKKFTFTGDMFDPMEMKAKKTKSELEIVDSSKNVMKMYEPGPDGKEMLTFEMTCTKK